MNAVETPATLADYLDVLRRRRIYLLTIVPAALLIAIFLAYALSPLYRATATILLEPSSIPAELVQTTVTTYADQQFELVQRRLMTADLLEKIVTELDPYPEAPELSARQKAELIAEYTLVERVDPITFEILNTSNAFSIHYHNSDPQMAVAIARKIAELFLEYNRQSRDEQATGTYEFVSAQVKELEKRIEEADQRIAQFKTRHGDALPESQARNIAATERVDRELQTIEAQVRLAEDRQALLKVQLGQLSPTLAGTAVTTRAELATLQAQLADARVRYTPDHPDVKRLQRQIEALTARIGTEQGTAAVVPDNPDYLAVQSQLTGVERELAALRANAARARAQIANYQSRLSVAPAVEREYSELTRVRDALLAQYQDMQAKLGEADVARNLETAQMGARFALIRAPSVPDSPYAPNRLGIILLGIVLGGGLAAGLAAFAESSDPSVRSARDLRELTKLPTIAAVPLLVNSDDRGRQRRWWIAYAGAMVVATALVALTAIVG
jgi:polysaccharide chain length determinant protein (PEP-CTERM system associated)